MPEIYQDQGQGNGINNSGSPGKTKKQKNEYPTQKIEKLRRFITAWISDVVPEFNKADL
jgi:hypothetical protein